MSRLDPAPSASSWTLKNHVLQFGPLPKLMGILNVTPDSFSDGGNFFSTQTAVDHALRLEDEGADLLDIGGESTRPYSIPVSSDEERRRVLPVVEKLMDRLSIPISIDTTKAEVAAGAIDLGVDIINDVSGFTFDPEMLPLAVRTGVGICGMHMQGTPQTMQDNPTYQQVTEDILSYLAARDRDFVEQGIAPERICLDPGIGFGKTHEHNLELLRHVAAFHRLQRPLLVGHSRKGFIAKVIGDKQADRTAGTIGVSLALARQKIQILRVHDVLATRQALLLFEAAGGLET